jgi:hypothetical protein
MDRGQVEPRTNRRDNATPVVQLLKREVVIIASFQ